MERAGRPSTPPIAPRMLVVLFFHAVAGTAVAFVAARQAAAYRQMLMDLNVALPTLTIRLFEVMDWARLHLLVVIAFWAIFLAVDVAVFAALCRPGAARGALAWALSILLAILLVYVAAQEAMVQPMVLLQESISSRAQ